MKFIWSYKSPGYWVNITTTSAGQFVKSCILDRFAVIVPEYAEQWAKEHAAEIYECLPCTGMLVLRKAAPRKFYHATKKQYLDSITANGLWATDDECCTYGAGVIYTYPQVHNISTGNWVILEVDYSGPYLEEIVRYEADEEDFPPECLILPIYVDAVRIYSEV